MCSSTNDSQLLISCPRCQGKGKIIKKTCHVCKGRKISKNIEEVSVVIEKGWRNGKEITFQEYGEETSDLDPGDLIFVVEELKHAKFTRRSNDLIYNLEITLKEALLGFSKTIIHLDGHEVAVSKEGVTQPGEKIRMPKEGMPVNESVDDFGNLIVNCVVVFPQNLTEEQKAKLETLFAKRGRW